MFPGLCILPPAKGGTDLPGRWWITLAGDSPPLGHWKESSFQSAPSSTEEVCSSPGWREAALQRQAASFQSTHHQGGLCLSWLNRAALWLENPLSVLWEGWGLPSQEQLPLVREALTSLAAGVCALGVGVGVSSESPEAELSSYPHPPAVCGIFFPPQDWSAVPTRLRTIALENIPGPVVLCFY